MGWLCVVVRHCRCRVCVTVVVCSWCVCGVVWSWCARAGVVPVHTGCALNVHTVLPFPTHHTHTQKGQKRKRKRRKTYTQRSTEHACQRGKPCRSKQRTKRYHFFLSAKSNPINVCTCFFFNSVQNSVMMWNKKRFARHYRYEPPRNRALVKKKSPSFGSKHLALLLKALSRSRSMLFVSGNVYDGDVCCTYSHTYTNTHAHTHIHTHKSQSAGQLRTINVIHY